MSSTRHQTVLEIVEEQFEEPGNHVPASLAEGLGFLHLQMHSLESELSKPSEEQDAERIFQGFTEIAATAVAAATQHVLPAIQRGNQ